MVEINPFLWSHHRFCVCCTKLIIIWEISFFVIWFWIRKCMVVLTLTDFFFSLRIFCPRGENPPEQASRPHRDLNPGPVTREAIHSPLGHDPWLCLAQYTSPDLYPSTIFSSKNFPAAWNKEYFKWRFVALGGIRVNTTTFQALIIPLLRNSQTGEVKQQSQEFILK